MKIQALLLPLLTSLSLLASPFYLVPVSAQATAVPGRSIGRLSLGMPRTEVWKHIGRPMAAGTFTVSGRVYRLDVRRNPSSSNRVEVFSQHGRVVQIERDVTDAQRREYLFPSLRRQHPHLQARLYTEYEGNGSTIVADDVLQGGAWAVYIHDYKHNEFNTHLLSEIGPDRVIIHRLGVQVLPSPGKIKDTHDPYLGDIHAWFAAKQPQPHKGN